jgi:hypothetical protein
MSSFTKLGKSASGDKQAGKRDKSGVDVTEEGSVMQRAPITSDGLLGMYPHIPPQTLRLKGKGQCSCNGANEAASTQYTAHRGSPTEREAVVVTKVVATENVEVNGEVVITVMMAVSATLA